MAAELHRIRQVGEQIVVLPDFDMDGITSGVLGWAGLSELGFNVGLYIPDYKRGHDISVEAVRELRAQFPTATTVLTCDGGINSNEGIEEARRLGFRTLVTDHHMELPPGSVADIAVNPVRMSETYEHSGNLRRVRAAPGADRLHTALRTPAHGRDLDAQAVRRDRNGL